MSMGFQQVRGVAEHGWSAYPCRADGAAGRGRV